LIINYAVSVQVQEMYQTTHIWVR